MAPSIEQIVAQIRTAVFGRDVRENIALGIEKCYEDTQDYKRASIESQGALNNQRYVPLKKRTFTKFYQGNANETITVNNRCHSDKFYCGWFDEIIITGDFTGIKAAIGSESGADSGWFNTSGYRYRIGSNRANSNFYVNVAKTDGSSSILPESINLTITIIDNSTGVNDASIINEQNFKNVYNNIIPVEGVTKQATIKGISVQQNNGLITVNGTASDKMSFNVMSPRYLPNLQFTLSGTPYGGAWGRYGLVVYKETSSDVWEEIIGCYSGPRNFVPEEGYRYIIDLTIWSGINVNNLVFEPKMVISNNESNIDIVQNIYKYQIENAINLYGDPQWSSSAFVQGRRNVDLTNINDATRCTLNKYFRAEKGDAVVIRNNSKPLTRFALAGSNGYGTQIFDSGWNVYDQVFKIENTGFYYVNASHWGDNNNITPADVDISVSFIKRSKELDYYKASGIKKIALSGDKISDLSNDMVANGIIIDLPANENGYNSITVRKKSINYAEKAEFETGSMDLNGENIGASDRTRTKNFLKIDPSEFYTLTYSLSSDPAIAFYDKNFKNIFTLAYNSENRIFKTPIGAEYLRLAFNDSTRPSDLIMSKNSDEFSFTIDVNSIAEETIYGGKIILNKDGTGYIRKEIHKVLGSDLAWTLNSYTSNTFNGPLAIMAPYEGYDRNTGKSVHLDGYSTESSINIVRVDYGVSLGVDGDVVYVKNKDYSTLNAFINYISDKAITYPIRVKKRYDFSNNIISEMLQNANGIFSSNYGDLKVIYTVDTKEYVNETFSPEIKEYYRDEVNSTIASVKSCMTEPCVVFPLITDIHYGCVNGKLPFLFDETWKNMMAVGQEIRFDAIICLGDVQEGNFTKSVAMKYASHVSNMFRKFNVPYLLAIGNHDDNRYTDLLEDEEIYKSYQAYICNRVIRNPDSYGCDFYVDYPEYKIRFISINSNADETYKFSTDTADWFENVALDTPDNYLAVVLTHISPIAEHNYNNTLPTNSELISTAITTYKTNGKPIIELYGHSHADTAYSSPYLSVGFNCSKYEINTGEPALWPSGATKPFRIENDYTEDSWDVVIIRPESRKINFIRFGAGVDREFTY